MVCVCVGGGGGGGLDCKTAFCSVLYKVVYCSVEMSFICAAKW